MNRTGISRRHLVAALVAAFGAAACSPFRVPRMGEGPPRVPVRSAFRMGPAPIKGAEARFAFVEISGAPPKQTMDFTKAITSEARSRNLNVVQQDDPSATYLVRGYLSAIGDRKGTLLVYVWDVSDADGRRLHRISGQEPTTGSGTHPWAGIDAKAARAVAERTIDNLVAWVS